MAGIRGLMRRVEGRPATQYSFHKVMSRVWVIMTPVAIAVCIFAPALWLRISIIYVVVISHYANYATDTGAMAAANASTPDDITAYAIGRAGSEDPP
jgi:hypothetical protein